jgi:hypothetical protein
MEQAQGAIHHDLISEVFWVRLLLKEGTDACALG